MVKVEHPAPKVTKQRTRITTKDLPSELTADGDWLEVRRAFLAWVGALKDPWTNHEDDIADALLVIGCAHRGNDYQLTTIGTKYVEVAQVSCPFLIFELISYS
jgi:hypothetical protein